MDKEKNIAQKVKIEGVELIENHFHDRNGNIYNALKLIEQSKKYKDFYLPLAGIDISRMPWEVDTMDSFIYHTNRINKTDLKDPIILNDEGVICDGWHRVAKAILNGETFIKVIRLESMPEKDRKEEA